MRRCLFLMVIAYFLASNINAHAEGGNQSKMNSVNEQLEILTHDLDYLRLTYEGYSLNNDLKLVTLQMDSYIKDMRMSIYIGNYSKEAYRGYKKLYDAFHENLEAYKRLIASKRYYYKVKLENGIFNEDEKDLLSKSYGMMDGSYDTAKITLEEVKRLLDLYYESM